MRDIFIGKSRACRRFAAVCALVVWPCVTLAEAEVPRLKGDSPQERAAAMLRYVASCRPAARDENYPKAAVPAYVARLVLDIDTEYALNKLHSAVVSRIDRAKRADKDARAATSPGAAGLDPFDKVALVNAYFLTKRQLPAATVAGIREYVSLYAHREWRGYGAMNYRLMMDGAGFLAAEEWPEIIDADGLDAERIKEATRARLLTYFDGICRHNYREYGSPIYAAVNLAAVRMLAEYARDEAVRQRAELTLDAMFVDLACSWNQGYNAGTAARAKYWISTDTGPESMAATAAAAWIWFGSPRSISTEGIGWSHSAWMAMPGRYQLPETIIAVANQRAQPSVYRGCVSAMPQDQVHRTVFHSPGYSLCSQWDHPVSPTAELYKESRRNMLKWISSTGSSTFAVCMENPRRPYRLQENVANPLGYGENPFSQYLQHEGTLIGVYAVPGDYPYFRLYAPFTNRGAIQERLESAGWVCCHNGSMLLGFHCVKPWHWDSKTWDGYDMLWCEDRRNGWIVETCELSRFAGGGVSAELRRFADALSQATQIDASNIDGENPALRFRNLNGKWLQRTWLPHGQPYAGQARIDDRAVEYSAWLLHENPWVRQDRDSPSLRIEINGQTLSYDFDKWQRVAATVPR